ncbi:MAG TPA: MaoC family dehydratase [Methylobacterium sp.]|nr:MaoC family dehydratase [Methylobacterium sp.]
MTRVCFEDFAKGQVIESPALALTRDAIVTFAREFDAQPFHTDEVAAKDTFVGTLIASGWHSAALGMRLLQESAFRGGSSMGSPGIAELRWLKPVLPGDAIRLAVTVEDCRGSASKPDRGFVRFAMAVLNQRDETVMTQAFTVMFPRRGAEPLPPRAVELSEAAPVAEPTDAEIMPFLERAEIGTTRDLGPHVFTAEAITAFARAYDPQEFHLDPEAARRSHFGGLCASGWHTAAIWMTRIIATRARDAALTARSGPVPMLGPSPGFRDMRWLAPVYAGDTIRYASTLIEKRASASRPGWGLATSRNTGTNQRGEAVFAFTGSVFWQWAP